MQNPLSWSTNDIAYIPYTPQIGLDMAAATALFDGYVYVLGSDSNSNQVLGRIR